MRLPECPVGWTVELDNDPNWQTTVEGKAIVGAAALPPTKLIQILLIGDVPTVDVLDPKDHIRAAGKLTLMRDDGELFGVAVPRIDLVPLASGSR